MSSLISTGELADAASLQGTPLPLTKQKTVRCYKENIKKDDGKNFEIEKIRKDEDVIETLQQRHSRDTNCVVVTSVSDTDTLPDAKLKEYSGGSVDTGPDIDLTHLSHDMGSQYGGGGSADISLGQDYVPPRLDTGFGDLHDTPHLDIPSVPSVPRVLRSMHEPPS
ncbi:Protein of unknown function [Gryllus bimaculatus]|nr:Protein of unknown function [Gryllus bimaculatus]